MTMALSNVAVQYLNYPTQVVFKSCKTIPVMLLGVFYYGKKYNGLEYLAMLSLSVGMIAFTLGDRAVNTPQWSSTGIPESPFPSSAPFYSNRLLAVCVCVSSGLVLISLALAADGLIGNVQEYVTEKIFCKCERTHVLQQVIGMFTSFGVSHCDWRRISGLYLVLGSYLHLSSHADLFDCWLHW